MRDKLNVQDSEKVAEKGFQIAQLVEIFMKEKYDKSFAHIPPRKDFYLRDECLMGLWQRIYCWLKTLSKLNQTSDFQAIATASRSLLELYVDMILIHSDESSENADKMYWWFKSEKLKACELKINFIKKNNINEDITWLNYFILTEKDTTNINRKRIWGIEGKHPNCKRWTGNDLFGDVKKADKLFLNFTTEILGESLENFYETKYRMSNWDIHSGISSIHGYQPQKFSLGNFRYFLDCSNFGILSTKLLYIELELNKVILNFDELFEDLINTRNEIIVQ